MRSAASAARVPLPQHLLAELHPDRNAGLDVASISAGSGRRLWAASVGMSGRPRLTAARPAAAAPTAEGHALLRRPRSPRSQRRSRRSGTRPATGPGRLGAPCRARIGWRGGAARSVTSGEPRRMPASATAVAVRTVPAGARRPGSLSAPCIQRSSSNGTPPGTAPLIPERSHPDPQGACGGAARRAPNGRLWSRRGSRWGPAALAAPTGSSAAFRCRSRDPICSPSGTRRSTAARRAKSRPVRTSSAGGAVSRNPATCGGRRSATGCATAQVAHIALGSARPARPAWQPSRRSWRPSGTRHAMQACRRPTSCRTQTARSGGAARLGTNGPRARRTGFVAAAARTAFPWARLSPTNSAYATPGSRSPELARPHLRLDAHRQ